MGFDRFKISSAEERSRELYDIVAQLPDSSSKEQVPAMVHALLEERFHVVLRIEKKQIPVYALIAGKNGPKLTPKPADYTRAPNSPLTPITLDAYASLIQLDRPVVNQTGIEGEYLLDVLANLRARMPASIAAASGSEPSDPMAVFQTVERLGLRLERRDVTLPYVIVERVDKPTEN